MKVFLVLLFSFFLYNNCNAETIQNTICKHCDCGIISLHSFRHCYDSKRKLESKELLEELLKFNTKRVNEMCAINRKYYPDDNVLSLKCETSCTVHTFYCLNESLIELSTELLRKKKIEHGIKYLNNILDNAKVPQYCFLVDLLYNNSADKYNQQDCNSKRWREELKNTEDQYLLTVKNCSGLYGTIDRDIYFLNKKEKQKYIKSMKQCSAIIEEILKKEGKIK